MEARQRTLVHGAIALLGVILMIGGLARGKHGATVVGLIVAAVNTQLWLRGRRNG